MCHLTEAFTNGTGPLSSNVDLPAWGYRVYVKDTQPRTSRYILYDKFDRNKLRLKAHGDEDWSCREGWL